MHILIMGMGYVGVATGLVFAELGWKVTGLDPDESKIRSLENGRLPFHEPGLNELLTKHLAEGSVTFTSSEEAIPAHEVIFLCVGTPAGPDGAANLDYIRQAAHSIGSRMANQSLIVIKSTVPVGTHEQVADWIKETQKTPVPVDVVSNPEFLREGSALRDALKPDRIIIGADNPLAADKLRKLYEALDCPLLCTDPRTAEMIKYASNAFLATKISFINELARICEP